MALRQHLSAPTTIDEGEDGMATLPATAGRPKKDRAGVIGWAFLLPALISFTLFKYYPIILGMVVSFFKVNIVDLPGDFVGLDNYVRAFRDENFFNAVSNNIEFLLTILLLNFWVPIVLATLINEVRRGKTFMILNMSIYNFFLNIKCS